MVCSCIEFNVLFFHASEQYAEVVLESHLQDHAHGVVVGVGTTVVAVASILTWGVINAVNLATSLAIVTRCGATAAGWLGL